MGIRYADRTRVSTSVGQWVNLRQPLGITYSNARLLNTAGTTVTANASAHTYGAWTEIVASLPADTSCLYINVYGINATTVNTATIVSIGTGTAGNESELFAFAAGSSALTSATLLFSGNLLQVPVRLNSGTRIAARIQSLVTGGKTASININSFDADPNYFVNGPTVFDTLGVSLATSEGTSLAASNAYTEIVASTSNPYRGVVLVGSAASNNMIAAGGTMTIAVGASGSEVDFGTISYQSGSTEFYTSFINQFFARNIPIGSRLSVKQSVNTTTIDASLIGVI